MFYPLMRHSMCYTCFINQKNCVHLCKSTKKRLMNGNINKMKLYVCDSIYIVGITLFPAFYYLYIFQTGGLTIEFLGFICLCCIIYSVAAHVIVQSICNICVDEHKPIQRWPGIKTALSTIIVIPDVFIVGMEKLWIPFSCLILWKTYCTWKYYRSLVGIREKILRKQLNQKS